MAVQQNDRNSAFGKALLFCSIERSDGIHDNPIDVLLHERMDIALLPFRVQVAIAKNDIRASGECRVFRPASNVSEERIADVADDQPDNLGPASHQPTSKSIG